MHSGRWIIGPYLIGATMFMVIGLAIYGLQATGKSAAAIAMSKDMDMRDMAKFWAFPFLQSSGLVALLLSYIAVLLGLSRQMLKGGVSASIAMNYLHRHVALCVVALLAIHMLTTALDAMGDSWRTVLIPGTWADKGWPEAVWGYNLGIGASYLLILIGPSYYMRRFFSRNNWIYLHRLIALVYLFSVWHAMILGLDLAYYKWLRPVIWLAQIPALALVMIRIYGTAFEKAPTTHQRFGLNRVLSMALFVLSAAGILSLLIIVATGNSDFITTV